MTFDHILIRLGEITVKGRNRNRFETEMLKQVKHALRAFPGLTFIRTFGRLYIELGSEPYEPVAERLKDVFGISSFSPVKRVEPELQAIREGALAVMRSFPQREATFKVKVSRRWKGFPHDTMSMNHLVGAHVLRNMPNIKVDVHNPDIELNVEIQEHHAYVYCEVVPGAGGFPYGSNGKAVALLSGGIDSPVAIWMAMRKGLEIEAIHFHSYPFTSKEAQDKVVALAKQLSHYAGSPFRLHLVPFTDIQTRLAQSGQDHLIITLMRRSMLRIAQKIAERSGALAIVTGDSLGQVASQTLGSMNVIGRTSDLPLLRPLIAMDKLEIITMAKRIGTYETSILPYEDCCTLFVPKSPATNPNLRIVERIERGIPELSEMIAKAVEGTETLELVPDESAPAVPSAADRDDWF